MAYTIIENFVSKLKYLLKCPHLMTPIGITVHNTANDAPAINEVKYMIGNTSSTSFHVAIDDVNVVIAIPFNRNAHHAGDGSGNGNRKTIGIEICYSKSGGARFDNAEKNAAHYIATLLKENNWTTKDVYTHQHWSGKNCPHRTMANGWERFLNMIQVELDKLNGKNTSPVPTTPITTTTRSYLMKGDKGAEVKQLQNDLNYLGYSCGTADGIFGTKTDSALRKFQSTYKLEVDGKYGNASKSQMSKAIAIKKASTVVSTPTATYTRNQFIKDVQKAIGVTVDGIVGNKTLGALVTVSKSKNNRHAVIKPLQRYLNALGYNCGTVDGIAGSKFDSAAKSWAKANGCVADGEFTKGGKSWKRILGVL